MYLHEYTLPQVAKLSQALQTKHLDLFLSLISSLEAAALHLMILYYLQKIGFYSYKMQEKSQSLKATHETTPHQSDRCFNHTPSLLCFNHAPSLSVRYVSTTPHHYLSDMFQPRPNHYLSDMFQPHPIIICQICFNQAPSLSVRRCCAHALYIVASDES